MVQGGPSGAGAGGGTRDWRLNPDQFLISGNCGPGGSGEPSKDQHVGSRSGPTAEVCLTEGSDSQSALAGGATITHHRRTVADPCYSDICPVPQSILLVMMIQDLKFTRAWGTQ